MCSISYLKISWQLMLALLNCLASPNYRKHTGMTKRQAFYVSIYKQSLSAYVALPPFCFLVSNYISFLKTLRGKLALSKMKDDHFP